MALIKSCLASGGGKKSEYKFWGYNPSAASANIVYGYDFSADDLDGFTAMTLESSPTGATYSYIADGGSETTFTSPLTIPSFTSSLKIRCNSSVVTHATAEVTAILS